MRFGVKIIRLLILIFYFIAVVLEHINLELLNKARVYQTCTSNESYIINSNNIEAYITLNCSTI